MQIYICVEIDDTWATDDEICDGVREACFSAVANMRSLGLLAVDQERYITEKVSHPAIGQVSYFRPD